MLFWIRQGKHFLFSVCHATRFQTMTCVGRHTHTTGPLAPCPPGPHRRRSPKQSVPLARNHRACMNGDMMIAWRKRRSGDAIRCQGALQGIPFPLPYNQRCSLRLGLSAAFWRKAKDMVWVDTLLVLKKRHLYETFLKGKGWHLLANVEEKSDGIACSFWFKLSLWKH